MNALFNRARKYDRAAARHAARRRAAGIAWGLMAVSVLTACGDRTSDRRVGQVRPPAEAPAPAPPSSDGMSPSGAPPANLAGSLPDGVATTTSAPPPTPEETRTAWREGVALYDKGAFAEASVRLEVASEGRPDDPYVHYLTGLALWKSGRLEESESALLRSAALNDGSARTFVNLARVRLLRKDFEGALQSADRAIVLEPGSAQALHQRGRALDGLNRGDEARDTLRQARAADPGNGYIANTLGYLLLRRGRIDEAIVELEAAREAIPQVAYVRNNLGTAYERAGEIDKAAAEFLAAVEAGDSDGKGAGNLARIEPIRGRLSRRADAAASDR
jgi:Flp pilus assembly protein TadD